MRGKTIIFISLFVILLNLSFVNADLTDGLISYYKLDETSGVVIDELGLNNGTNHNTTRGVDGKIGSAYDFDGVDDYINAGNDSSLNPTSVMSIGAWIKADSIQLDYNPIVMKGNWDSYNFYVYNDSSYPNSVWFDVYSGGYPPRETGANNIINIGQWHYIVGTYNGTTIKLFVDGIEVDSVIYTSGGIDQTTDDFEMGGDVSYNDYFNGTIDELGIWNRALSSTEVSQLYNYGTGKSYPFYFENAIFDNVNIINNLNVGKDVSALKGFFNYLGSSILRIIEGWFINLNAINIITQNLEVNNKSVCLEDGTNCPSADVPDIKSGSAFVIEDSCTSITFNTAFSSTPVVTGNVENNAENNVVSIKSLNTTGFDLCLQKLAGGGGNYTVYWVATNVGNP